MKITLTRLLETSKVLTTEAGQQLKDMVTYLAEFVDQTVRTLRNGITFADNFDCATPTVSLKHNVASVVASTKAVTGILPIRTFSSVNALDSFTWYYDEQNRLSVKASFVGSPAEAVNVTLILLY